MKNEAILDRLVELAQGNALLEEKIKSRPAFLDDERVKLLMDANKQLQDRLLEAGQKIREKEGLVQRDLVRERRLDVLLATAKDLLDAVDAKKKTRAAISRLRKAVLDVDGMVI